MNYDELDSRERDAFRNLPRTETPPAYCEEEVVDALWESGALREQRSFWSFRFVRIAGAMAALLLSFYVGNEFGKRSAERQMPEAVMPAVEEENQASVYATVAWEPEKIAWPYSPQ